jgi:bifunctional DNA-binding transcriptional regulator/antitoxin component of YhaV-PrlF toxin-antitoxin module
MTETMKFNTRMDARGRVVIPRMIREALKIFKGSTAQFEQKGDSVTVTVVNRERRAKAETSRLV